MPSRFTSSYSDRCVRRRVFGKQNKPAADISNANLPSLWSTEFKSNFATSGYSPRATQYKRSLPPKIGEDFSKPKESQSYCPGDSAGVSDVPAGDSVVAAGASGAAGLIISVAAGGGVVGVGLVSGMTVSVFCSHAARSAAPARMQMYFFIIGDAYCFNRSIAASAVFRPSRMLLETQIARHEG
jgi:hypothetical protein